MAFRAVVVSDVHGDAQRLAELISEINGSDRFVFCGDGLNGVTAASGRITVPMVCVKGNNDFNTVIADRAVFTIGGVRALVTHGHIQNARRGVSGVVAATKANACRIAFFGHTHAFYAQNVDGVYLFNPGALCEGSYGVLTIDGKAVDFSRKTI